MIERQGPNQDSTGTPELFDVVVVGGGPAGTATAFRAHELGLKVLVIDYDDLMKRIRDYAKDKLILPTFGGGDRLCFPKGGALISALRFSPIDKDDMCVRWKGLYAQHGVPFQIGIELTGIERRDDGTLDLLAWDHGTRCEAPLHARAVVLALGRGVPRRFDIPGNCDGISFRLRDPAAYLGHPACVIGGGTSAAEAVIAISNAKIAANDPTAIHWSYRGDRMPRVSKALAEVFFGAYIGNGNIRYHPRSEPTAVITADDREEYLAVRIDRRTIEDRPRETTHLEFHKRACIACIGEDLPAALLSSIGIEMVHGGARGKKRMVVTPHLESRADNIFVVGDLLSQAYFATDDFAADPASWREIKHRGNVKSALRDGVLVAGVLRQRLDGRARIEVQVEDDEELEETAQPVAKSLSLVEPLEDQGPPAASLAVDRRVDMTGAFLVRLLPGESAQGVEEEEYPLAASGVTTLGRDGCDLSFSEDTLLAPHHASIARIEDDYFLRDDGSATGVFLRVAPGRKRAVDNGDLIQVGHQFLLVSGQDGRFAVQHFDDQGHEVGSYPLSAKIQIFGRQAPDVTLDPEDHTLSRRQLALAVEGNRVMVKDLKSVNGTYVRVRSAMQLEHGDQIRLGQQRFLFSLRDDASLSAGHSGPSHLAAQPPPPAEAMTKGAPETAAEGPCVAFAGNEGTLVVEPGQTICEAAEAAGISINAECHSGICGSDPIRILAGHEHLEDEAGELESETLEELCDRKPGQFRLACMVRVRGPVKVEIL